MKPQRIAKLTEHFPLLESKTSACKLPYKRKQRLPAEEYVVPAAHSLYYQNWEGSG